MCVCVCELRTHVCVYYVTGVAMADGSLSVSGSSSRCRMVKNVIMVAMVGWLVLHYFFFLLRSFNSKRSTRVHFD